MNCQDCDSPATVHTSVVVGDAKQEIHLCRPCAEKRKLITPADKPNLPALVKQVVGNVGFLTQDLAKLKCPDCGISYMEFRKQGRLGCPNDYAVFREGLIPLLDRVHRASRHMGKHPADWQNVVAISDQIRRLRRDLQSAIDTEDYEAAAQVRDEIRQKESMHGH